MTCVLSGMNSEAMVNENIRIASQAEPGHLTQEDLQIVEQIKQIIGSGKRWLHRLPVS